METQVASPASTPVATRKTYRQRVDGLMDHIMSKLDLGTGTERHERVYLKTGNLLGAAGELLGAYEKAAGSDVMPESRFRLESGEWDQTETLQRLAAEQGVTCQISNDGAHTSVDLTGADRAKVSALINAVINQAVNELKTNETFE